MNIMDFAESRAATANERKAQEADRLLNAAGTSALIALEVDGRCLSSEAFADHLRTLADRGTKSCAFLIGGPDGHGPAVRSGSALKLSLGPLTLPHGLARVVLTEQLYRAATILTGHPYHRA
jgi:23S rRNA (pseudouridine1915-N3)-methyltransferase